MEVILGKERRRWSEDEKRGLVAETFVEGATVNAVARRHRINPSMLFTWRKQYREQLVPATVAPMGTASEDAGGSNAEPGFVPVAIAGPAPCIPSSVLPDAHPMIELKLGRGASMRIVGAVDPALAVAIMKAMQRR